MLRNAKLSLNASQSTEIHIETRHGSVSLESVDKVAHAVVEGGKLLSVGIGEMRKFVGFSA